MEKIPDLLREVVRSAVGRTPECAGRSAEGEILPVPRPQFGDYSSNVAFKLASKDAPPPAIAAALAREISAALPPFLARVEAKGGFVNFFVRKDTFAGVIARILADPENYGRSAAGAGSKVLIEFVSANPTGPLTIAHGRQAAFGEALARIMAFAGHAVTKEYYHNDAGRQITLLGESLRARHDGLRGKETPIPEDGYQGEYLVEIAKKIGEAPDDPDFFRRFAVAEISASIRADLERFGVTFDSWVKEQTFHDSGRVAEALGDLRERGHIYEAEGATWFRSTAFGDDKDRVVIKNDGSYTYIVPDIAYHRDKMRRGFDRLINILGPDHHGYIGRLKAAVTALGFPADRIHILIVQLTTLYRGEEKLRMSTRAGEFVTLKQLMDEVGPDASKFFFIFRRAESHLDFDLEVAKKQSVENPVYYLQYASVRMRHVLEHAQSNGVPIEGLDPDPALLKEPEETALCRALAEFPDLVERVARTLEVHLAAEYLLNLARTFHSYYQKHRVVTDDRPLTTARLALTAAAYRVFSRALELLNISLPDRM